MSLALFLFFTGLGLGLLVGKVITDSRWRDASEEPMRVHSGAALFHVVREGDARKAREVAASCEQVQQERGDDARQARVVRLCLDANRVWNDAVVYVDPGEARVVASRGTEQHVVVERAETLDQLEVLVWKRLEDA